MGDKGPVRDKMESVLSGSTNLSSGQAHKVQLKNSSISSSPVKEGFQDDVYKNGTYSSSTASSIGVYTGVVITKPLGQINDVTPQKRSKVGSTSSEFRNTSQQLRENGKSIIHEAPISSR